MPIIQVLKDNLKYCNGYVRKQTKLNQNISSLYFQLNYIFFFIIVFSPCYSLYYHAVKKDKHKNKRKFVNNFFNNTI